MLQRPSERKVITAFLSSPGDLTAERAAVKGVIRNLNEELLHTLGLHFELVSSEDMLPDVGHPQDVINRQIPDHDVFLGVMWTRFGTPTARAGSGTEEELLDALERRRRTGQDRPRVLFYFCDRPVPFPRTTADIDQLRRVIEFRDRYRADLLYSTFSDLPFFETLVRRHLAQIALERVPGSSFSTSPLSSRRAFSSAAGMHQLEDKLKKLVWVSYSPVDFDPAAGQYANTTSLETDLRVLKQGPVGGIITFGSEASLATVPALAKAVGLEGVIMGIFDPCSASEMSAARAAREYVDGYCVGHLGLREGRYSQAELERAILSLREETQKPISTTEALEDYFSYDGLSACVDWLFPDVHHYWHQGTDPDAAVADLRRTTNAIRHLRERRAVDQPVLMKMLSYPSEGGNGLSQQNQLTYFDGTLGMMRDDVSVPARLYASLFAAFDNAWKTPARGWSQAELHTGLYDLTRSPKAAVQTFSRTSRRW